MANPAPIDTTEYSHEVATLIEFLSMPLDSTKEIFDKFKTLPGAQLHGSGNSAFLYVPGTREDKVIMASHVDTVWQKGYPRKVEAGAAGFLKIEAGVISTTHPTAGIGADDRAGVAILWLLRKLGHSIILCAGEEIGCIGAHAASSSISDIINSHQFGVEFDRMGSHDFKCYSVGSDEFRAYLSESLPGYSEPNRSSYSDIVVLCDEICGVNLSVGYYNEHMRREHLVISEWLNTYHTARKWLSGHGLPRFVQPPQKEINQDLLDDLAQ